MSKETRINRCKSLYRQLMVLKPQEFGNSSEVFSDFDGLSVDETKSTMKFVLETLEGLNTNNAWEDLTWQVCQSLEGLLQNLVTVYQHFKNSPDQNSFQNLAQTNDSVAYHLRLFGMSLLALAGEQLEKTSNLVTYELDRLTTTISEAETIRDEVKALIAPAVAGSLSQAFTARKDILLRGRIVWGIIALAIGVYCIHATYGFANAVSDALVIQKPADTQGNVMWLSILIRSVILIPLYAAFGFSFAQYRKERDFEEEYAHKAAVAASLPNYGDLTREPAVRDQIVTGATNVIFSSPTSRVNDGEKQDKVLGGVKEIIDSVAKLIPGKQ